MTRTTRAQRERGERRASIRVLGLALFELGGKMGHTSRRARAAGLDSIADEVAFMKVKIERWNRKISERSKGWTPDEDEG